MSLYSNVNEQGLINLRKLAEQQKNQRALEIKNRISKQTHDNKLAESLSPVTEKLDEVNESTQEVGDIIKNNNTFQLTIENTPITHQPKENTPTTHQPLENNKGMIYDVELENTLKKITDNTGFHKTYHDPQCGWTTNNHPIKMLRGTNVEINEIENNMSPGFRKLLVGQSYGTAKSMTDKNKLFLEISYRKQVVIIVNLQKVAGQVVIDILKMILIMMS